MLTASLSPSDSLDAAAPSNVGGARVPADASEWVWKRNCSMAPRQALAVYASLCAVSLGIAAFFWMHGATLVLPFAGVELVALGWALRIYARHAADRERIVLSSTCLLVEHERGGRLHRDAFRPPWVHVGRPARAADGLIELTGQGRRITVGRYLRPARRTAAADELRRAVQRLAQAGIAADAELRPPPLARPSAPPCAQPGSEAQPAVPLAPLPFLRDRDHAR